MQLQFSIKYILCCLKNFAFISWSPVDLESFLNWQWGHFNHKRRRHKNFKFNWNVQSAAGISTPGSSVRLLWNHRAGLVLMVWVLEIVKVGGKKPTGKWHRVVQPLWMTAGEGSGLQLSYCSLTGCCASAEPQKHSRVSSSPLTNVRWFDLA